MKDGRGRGQLDQLFEFLVRVGLDVGQEPVFYRLDGWRGLLVHCRAVFALTHPVFHWGGPSLQGERLRDRAALDLIKLFSVASSRCLAGRDLA